VLSISRVTTINTELAWADRQAIREIGWKRLGFTFVFQPVWFPSIVVLLIETWYLYSTRMLEFYFYFDKPARGNNEISNGNSLNVHRYSLLCCINLSTVWPLLSFKHSVVAFPIVLEARSYITVARMVISCLCICHICRRQWIRNRSTQECRNWKVTYLACIYFSFVALSEVYLRSWRIHSFSWLALALCFSLQLKRIYSSCYYFFHVVQKTSSLVST
jgi:hypothetical protein